MKNIYKLVSLTLLLQSAAGGWILHHFINTVFGNHVKGMCFTNVPPICKVQVLEYEQHEYCISKRKEEVQRSRMWYQITNGSDNVQTGFTSPYIPFLNQNLKNVQFHYATDPEESTYLMLLATWRNLFQSFVPTLTKMFPSPFKSLTSHKQLYNAYNNIVKQLGVPQYFNNPSMHADFTDQINTQSWDSDEAFIQRRLAGQCPFTLRKVTADEKIGLHKNKLARLLNCEALNYDTEIEIGDGEVISLKDAIEDERLFVSYIEGLNQFSALRSKKDKHNDRVVKNITSTIGLYILKKDGMLGIFAIQWDSKPDSPVYTPSSDPIEWAIAKAQIEFTENIYCQAYHHLGSMHYVYTVFCLSYRRHFSKQHPLYDMFKFHCEGTIPHISLVYDLPGLEKSLNITLTAGSGSESHKMGEKAFQERHYEKYDYDTLFRQRGLDDDRIKYYPFRDDSVLFVEEFEKFANEIVNLYYKQFTVLVDSELQSFANEISIDGTEKPDGGLGKLVGFPQQFTSKKQLKDFIVRFLWYNVIHASCNYALAPVFIPTQQQILYTYKSGKPVEELAEIFPGYVNPINPLIITGFYGILANLRANRLMDYFENTQDKRFGSIVRRSYYRFHNCIQKELEKRNKERKQRNLLGYQFIEPKWMTNSIHV